MKLAELEFRSAVSCPESEVKCKIAAISTCRQVKLWAPVPLPLVCTRLSLAVSPPLGGREGEESGPQKH